MGGIFVMRVGNALVAAAALFAAVPLFTWYAVAEKVKNPPLKETSRVRPPLAFEGISIPATDAEKSALRVSKKASVRCCGGRMEERAVSFRALFKSGAADTNGNVAGLVLDANGRPLAREDGSRFISANPDGNSVFKLRGDYYLITHFEEVPGAVYNTALDDVSGKEFEARLFTPVDFSAVGGTAMNCAASRTPWRTHLASEENYFFDAYWFDPASAPFSARHIVRCQKDAGGALTGGYSPPAGTKADYSWWCGAVRAMQGYFSSPAEFSPYLYGHMVEIALDRAGKAEVAGGAKRLALGRAAPEMALVLPDGKTVYLSDDGQYTGFYMFVADAKGDLSAGTLYMAAWRQEGEGARLEWVWLGHAEQKGLADILDRRPSFGDIFDVADPLQCPDGFRQLKTGDAGEVCLRLRDGTNGSRVSPKFNGGDMARTAAAFFETRRYGAWLGGTAEWNKAEGLAFDDDRKELYLAVTAVEGSMEHNLDRANDIRLAKNRCGAVFRFALGEASDTGGRKIGSVRVATSATPVLSGVPLKPGAQYADENGCHPDFIAGPDNIRYIGRGLLLIGEDTPYHFNNYAWAYNIAEKSLTRVASLPTGAEVGGGFAYIDTMGRFYIFMNVQHPFAAVAVNAAGEAVNRRFIENATGEEKRGVVGYISGLPALGR